MIQCAADFVGVLISERQNQAQQFEPLKDEPRLSRKFFDLICIPIVERTATDAFRRAREALRRARWVELRLDCLRSTQEIQALLARIQDIGPRSQGLIFTLRRQTAGGNFDGSLKEQIRWLSQAAALGRWLDVEMETAEAVPPAVLHEWRKAKSKLIVSFHDFKRTPARLDQIVRRLSRFQPDLMKIATQANSLSDAARLLELQIELSHKRQHSVVLGMGGNGLLTRVLGPSRGAAFTFAVVKPGKESAPGQLTIGELQHLYRIDQINLRTKVYGILGYPLVHSLSPALYNAAFKALKKNAVYLKFEAARLDDFSEWTDRLRVCGLAVTLPYKEEVLPFLSEIDAQAQFIGAVNTLHREKKGWFGFNTDFYGLMKPLQRRRIHLRDAPVLLLGAGGAARAAAALLAREKSQVSILNRTLASAQELARQFGHRAVKIDEIQGKYFKLVINATAVGMWPKPDVSPIDLSLIRGDVVLDLVYKPRETKLLQEARRRGFRTVSGIEMFRAQAEAQFKILTQQTLPASILNKMTR